MILESNNGIILTDCLLSFIILSGFILILSMYLTLVYQIKSDIAIANESVNDLKVCILTNCTTSHSVEKRCIYYDIKTNTRELCVGI